MEELQVQIDQIIDKSINDMKIKVAKVVNRHLNRMSKEQSRNTNVLRKSVAKQPPVRKSRSDRDRERSSRDDETDDE